MCIDMFTPRENPGYEKLSTDAAGLIAGWLQNGWYENSVEDRPLLEDAKEDVKYSEQGIEDPPESLI